MDFSLMVARFVLVSIRVLSLHFAGYELTSCKQLQGSISQEDVALSFIDSLKKPVRGSSDQVRRSDVLLHVIQPSRG